MTDRPSVKSRRNRWWRALGWAVISVAVLWAAAALWFTHPALAIGFLVTCGAIMWCGRHGTWAPVGLTAVTLVAAGGWFVLPARNDRAWEPDVAETAWAKIEGDVITLHNHRNFDWRSETDFTPRWETKTVRLSEMRQLDFIMTYWGSPHVYHTMLTFDFGPDGRVCVSIEARREAGESYSALAGMFRQYELIYVFGEERDLVHLRTSVRPHNDVHLFPLIATPAVMRAMFLDYIRTANALRERSSWYHSLLTNCSTTIRAHVRRADVLDPWDWRMLANGHADERLYEFGYVSRDLPLPELKRRSRINAAPVSAGAAPEFSARIRAGLPGF
jgi:hypothetical protein